MRSQNRTLDTISKFMDNYQKSYDLTGEEFRLPKRKLNMGTIYARNQKESNDFLYIIEDFKVQKMNSTSQDAEFLNAYYENLQFMFIFDRQLLQGELDILIEKVNDVLTNTFMIPFAIIMLLVMIFVAYGLREVAIFLTQPIIDLLFEIKVIIDHNDADRKSKSANKVKHQLGLIEKNAKKYVANQRKTQDFNLMLNYRPRNQEINQLYLAFSKLTKTIKFARNSLVLGENNQALLNYHEIADIFSELQNNTKLGICINNLGCIYLKKKQYSNSRIFLMEAIKLQRDLITQYEANR